MYVCMYEGGSNRLENFFFRLCSQRSKSASVRNCEVTDFVLKVANSISITISSSSSCCCSGGSSSSSGSSSNSDSS